MTNEVKFQLETIRSMLEKGQGYQVLPHTIPLWGALTAIFTLASNYVVYLSSSTLVIRAAAVLGIAAILGAAIVIDAFLTRKIKHNNSETVPYVHKQIFRYAWFAVFVALCVQIIMLGLGHFEPAPYAMYVFIASFVLYNIGLFSNPWYRWVACILAILNVVVVLLHLPLMLNVWAHASLYFVGFSLGQLLLPKRSSIAKHLASATILTASIVGFAAAGYALHYKYLVDPGELPVYRVDQLADKNPSERYILEVPAETIFPGQLVFSADTPNAGSMPLLKVRFTKTMQFVFDQRHFAPVMRIVGEKWEDGSTTRFFKRDTSIKITPSHGAPILLPWDYYGDGQCDCLKVIQ